MPPNLFTIAEPVTINAPPDIFPDEPTTPATFWTSRPARTRPAKMVHTGRYAVTCKKCGKHWTAHPAVKTDWWTLSESLAESHHCERFDALRPKFGQYANANLSRALVIKQITHNPAGSLHRCSDKCRTAKGPSCECSCGGMNHGKGWNIGNG